MIDIPLLFLGMLGAGIAVYLGKQEAIPGFPLLFDTASKEKEAAEHLKHIASTEKEIDATQKN